VRGECLMSKVMLIVGILLAAIGIALGLMVFFSPGPMQVHGVTLEVAAILLVGGVLSIGLGGVIGGLEGRGAAPLSAAVQAAPAIDEAAISSVSATAPAAVAVAEVAAESESLSPAVSETIRALEKAKTDLQAAFDEKPTEPAVAEEIVVEEIVEEAAEEEADSNDEGQLYILEERLIRGHPSRVLSDGTVEAETSEGWMRFENLEHLDEYLDAMEPPRP
jgi:hypothetical protein